MQIFSSMQRDISDKKVISRLIPLILIIVYPSLGNLYPALLPPLLGYMYVKWSEALRDKNHYIAIVWMVYALLFEAMWGLPMYGVWSIMILVYIVFDGKIVQIFNMKIVVKLISVFIFDFFYFIFLYGYGAIVNREYIELSYIFLYYLVIDVVGVLLF